MILPNLQEVEWAITQLENKESTREGYNFLANLYIVRDHMMAQEQPKSAQPQRQRQRAEYSMASGSDSEFMQAISGKDMSAVLEVLDEHMEVIRVLNPRAYESAIRRLSKI